MENPYEMAAEILKGTGKKSAFEDSGIREFSSVDLYGRTVQKKREEEDGQKFYLENETGSGEITVYQVFPGMEFVYNDIRMAYCNLSQKRFRRVIEINHCCQGRCECSFDGRSYGYMAEGDLAICSLTSPKHESWFPLGYYQGIMITLDMDQISEEMGTILRLLSIDMERIGSLFRERECYIIRANEVVAHIFSELYTVKKQVRQGYLKIKVLELLLTLTEMELTGQEQDVPYFSKSQINTVKAVHAFILEHLKEHFTLEELSGRFQISATSLKKCFKGVYGISVYAYLRLCRLELSRKLLKEGDDSIGEVAAMVGYENPNKFSAAFKKEYGISPGEYRKTV